MYSKLVIDVDLNNQPIISLKASEDVNDLRDKVVKRFTEAFGTEHNILQWVLMSSESGSKHYEIKPVTDMFSFILSQLEPLLNRDAYNIIEGILIERIDDPSLEHLVRDVVSL